jgi:hypothetical protein
MPNTFESEDSFFVKAAHRLSNPKCFSLIVREALIKAAVRKNGSSRDARDENLLFPPSVIEGVLVREKVAKVFGCKCAMCRSVKGREILTDSQLIDVVTAEEGAVQRQLFAVLAFMGAGFAARHLCSFHTFGWDDATQQNSIHSDVFEPLDLDLGQSNALSPAPEEIARVFRLTFTKMLKLFASPIIKLRSHETILSGENLPFINPQPLNSDKSSFGSLFAFEIHNEFREHDIPVSSLPIHA